VHIDFGVSTAGLIVGLVVGLTGMGGGALMTPILVLLFHIQPLAAVSSDLVAAAVMKPVGGAVHLRRGTVHRPLVRWLMIGSVPSAFAGVLVLRALGDGAVVQDRIKLALGIALLFAALSMVAKAVYGTLRDRGPDLDWADIPVRPALTVAIGAVGGLVVGMTSVGSGSLIIVALLAAYPRLRPAHLIGTDLVQAVPIVAAASVGHLLFGDFRLGLTSSLLVGALPGVYVGSRLSAAGPSRLIRPVLGFVVAASGLKLLGVPTATLGLTLLAGAVIAPLGWLLVSRALAGFAIRATPAAEMSRT
jgi:uncharacterized membrane protein YfcA